MSPKRTTPARPTRKPRKQSKRVTASTSTHKGSIEEILQSTRGPKSATRHQLTPEQAADYPSFPLTLRTLRLGIAGRLGAPIRQEKLAKLAKISQSHLSGVESGRVKGSQFMLAALAVALEVDLALVRQAYAGTRANLDQTYDTDN